jgi:threonine synthase
MQFYSTNNSSVQVSVREALFRSLPADGGLYMPTVIPERDSSFFDTVSGGSLAEVAYEMCRVLLADDLSDEAIVNLVQTAFPFDTPVVSLETGRQHVLELFHGPSLAFKDVGARFMAGLMSHYSQQADREVHILVATSGDTGGAVAMGFHRVPGVRVSILYPKGRVSDLQEKQLTTLGDNIQAFEVEGSFDDCQAMVKRAFLDPDLNTRLSLSSANSINIFRLIPQSFYFVRGYGQVRHIGKPIVVSVPSGNFGNLSAGMLAKRMGLPIERFVAATNLNNTVPRFLETGVYKPMVSVATISNAMDVGAPSNFPRLTRLLNDDIDQMREQVTGYFVDESATESTMRSVYTQFGYVACPHTAVGINSLNSYPHKNVDNLGLVLATAHPAKFKPLVDAVLGFSIDVPERLATFGTRTKQAVLIPAGFDAFKEALLQTV